jgi:ABC-type nitrate/sulfonate/bicarbonate transport system substrate-binding protein
VDLKGKSIGVNGLSGGAWIFAMLTLDYWGLVPEARQHSVPRLGDQGVIAQGLSAGAVDAAFLGYTYGKALESKGFRILADVEKLPIPYQGSGIMARRSFAVSSPAIVENVLRGLLESLAFIRDPANKTAVLKSLAKGLRLRRVEEAEEGYQSCSGSMRKKSIRASTASGTSFACSAKTTKRFAA